MFTHYRTRGFILNKRQLGESDELLIIYTEEFGQLAVLARSIRKIASKLKSSAEILYLSEIAFIQGKSSKTLTDAVLLDRFRNLRKSLLKTRLAFKIARLAEYLIREQEKNREVWQLLCHSFSKLNSSLSPSACYLVYYYFFWNLFSLTGYGPEIYTCLICREKVRPEKIYFSAEKGGLICQNCSKKVKLKEEINVKTVKLLRLILARKWLILEKIKISRPDINRLAVISDYYSANILKDNLYKHENI